MVLTKTRGSNGMSVSSVRMVSRRTHPLLEELLECQKLPFRPLEDSYMSRIICWPLNLCVEEIAYDDRR
ncbi:hypothetical protein Aduo_009169 [Ancylostoma duodenale]